ncbi:MAG: glycosyl transferase family 2 [Bacteroidetes bacterium 4572_77]|nr:MAG: glycosyl transferase family 2 [Bacteroidetes bacterium 4572_77]
MKLSVVIVNYNVKHFLEQCLNSVRIASKHVSTEVWVVDNNSVDQSVEMVAKKYPEVHLIANKDNPGFSVANNQAIKKSKGEYVLLLNPDTLVEEFTFKKVVDFMDQHADAGGLGVKMVDGNGNFLPESKRGLPTPAVAFYKIFGFSSVLPKSKTFGRYHLGYLDKEKTHSVDVLSGAFMLLRKKTLDKVGLLDETFFMYGEDIDLSYRITQGGYKNYYFPETRIIHYKGESTKKSSTNYVFTFYNAMIIFAKKHFSLRYARLFSLLIHMAIYLRAGISIIKRAFSRILLPLLDAGILYVGFYFIKSYWEQTWLSPNGGSYPLLYSLLIVPVYILILLLGILLAGGYDKPYQIPKLVKGLFMGIISILVMYALLPEDYRYSRAIIIAGTFWGFISLSSFRFIMTFLGVSGFGLSSQKNNRIAVVGSPKEAQRVAELLRNTEQNPAFIGLVNVTNEKENSEGVIGNINQLSEIIDVYRLGTVIFCTKDLSAQHIIDKMIHFQQQGVAYKIAPEQSSAIIGSQNISTTTDLYMLEVDSILQPENKRNKRLLDLLLALFLLLSLPLNIWFVKNKGKYIKNIFSVLFSTKTWVGYDLSSQQKGHELPHLKKGILNPSYAFPHQNLSQDTRSRLNLLYSRDYKITNDLEIIYKGFSFLGLA